MAKNTWYLFYVRQFDQWGVPKMVIRKNEFKSELDMLVWASEMQIPKGTDQNWVVSPDGDCDALRSDYYERIEHLRRQEAEKEAKLRAKEEARQRRIDNLKKAREVRKQKAQKEASCQAIS